MKKINTRLISLSLVVGIEVLGNGYAIFRTIYDPITADKIASAPPILPTCGNGRIIYGYDTNRDGKIDQIKEQYSCFGSKAAWPVFKEYTSDDEEFTGLLKLLGGKI